MAPHKVWIYGSDDAVHYKGARAKRLAQHCLACLVSQYMPVIKLPFFFFRGLRYYENADYHIEMNHSALCDRLKEKSLPQSKKRKRKWAVVLDRATDHIVLTTDTQLVLNG